MTSKKPLDVMCFCTQARRLALALTDRYGAAIAPSGLSIQQFALLRMIVRLEHPSVSALSKATGIERSTLGRNLKVLEKDGMVRLGAGPDARTRTPDVTAKAFAALGVAEPLWTKMQDDMATALPEDAIDTLKAAYDALLSLETEGSNT